MFLIWYFIFSFIYLIVLILDIFFYRILKFNNNLFNLILFKLNKLLDLFSLNNLILINNIKDFDNINYKNLYNNYKYFNLNLNIKYLNLNNSFLDILIFFTISKKFFNNFMFSFITGNFLFLIFFKKIINTKNLIKKINLLNFSNLLKLKNTNYNYVNYKKFNLVYSYNLKNIYNEKIISLITINNNLKKNILSLWNIKYAPSNFLKYANLNNLSVYNILFLRKNKVFNKGRYSRNRQYYRTGVYWCLYINIIAVIGIYFWFYRFTMNFGYLWWLLFIFIFSFIAPKAIKYRFYNISILINSFYSDIYWFSLILNNIIYTVVNYIFKIYYYININLYNNYFFGKNYNINFLNLLNYNKNFNLIYIWEYNNINYNSYSNFSIFKKFKYFLIQFLVFSFNK